MTKVSTEIPYFHFENKAFNSPIFIKKNIAQWHYVKLRYNLSLLNQSKNVGIPGRNSCVPL